MPGAGDIKAGRAYVELLLKDGAFQKGLKNASRNLQAFGGGVAAIGAGITAISGSVLTAFGGATKHFLTFGDELDKARQRTGLTVEALSELRHAAEQSGTDFGTLEKGIAKMQKSLTAGVQNGGAAADVFRELGLSVQTLAKLSPEDQFQMIGERITGIADPTRKAATAMAIFGKSGTQLLPMLEDVGALRQEARDLGLTMSGPSAAAAVKLGDQIANLQKSLGAVSVAIGNALTPALSAMVEEVQTVLTRVVKFAQANSGLIQSVAKIAAGAAVGGAALTALGTSIWGIGFAVGRLSTALNAAVSGFRVVLATVGLLTSPIALIAAGAIALGSALAYLAIPGDTLAEKWDTVKSSLLSGWNAIRDGAVQIFAALQETVLVAWDAIQAATSTVWDSIGGYVVGAWNSISAATGTILGWMQGAIIGAFSRISFTIKNWRLLLETAFVSAEYSVVKFANQTIYFFTVAIPGYLSWFADHWREVFTDIVTFTATVAGNIWENLANLWDSIVGLFSGEGFSFEWTPLTKGFESAIKELPKIAEREIGTLESSLQGQLEAISGQLGAAWDQHQQEFNAKIEAAKVGREAVQAGAAQKTDVVKEAAAKGVAGTGGPVQQAVSTFSASALAALGNGGTQDAIAEATKGTWEELKQARREAFLARHREGVFGA